MIDKGKIASILMGILFWIILIFQTGMIYSITYNTAIMVNLQAETLDWLLARKPGMCIGYEVN